MGSQFWLWLATIVMLVGGLAILLLGKRRTPAEEMQTILHGIVPLIAAIAYFSMAVGQGVLPLPTVIAGSDAPAVRLFYFARYIDWTFTTPLLLVSLVLTAMHAGRKRAGIIVGVVLADLLMIVTSLFFGASEFAFMKWMWFLVSCVAFLGVYYVIWVSAMEANRLERADVQASYRRSAIILSVLWFIYPLILAVSPDGLGVVSSAFSIGFIAVLDILAKVVYGFMAVQSDTKIVERDLTETGTAGTTYAATPRPVI